MPTKTNLPSTNHYIHLNSVAAKNAFINCSVYIIFFLGLTLCQDLLPFDLTIGNCESAVSFVPSFARNNFYTVRRTVQ